MKQRQQTIARVSRPWLGKLVGCMVVAGIVVGLAASGAEAGQKTVLLYGKTFGFRHGDAIDKGSPILKTIAEGLGYKAVISEDPAVFDPDRRLVLFNPALVDLTHLPVDFLSAKPNLLSFFDHMRENRMMPEPKNYNTWREKIYDVVSAAREDRYAETWNLPSGLTYKITGRPHPDGAVAFLIEDISAEISLTRRFRSELEMTQSVLDRFDDAVAVFSRLGVLTFTNAAYRDRWNCDPDSAFAEITIVDATKDWSAGCLPSPIWSEIRDFVLTLRERACWDAELVTTDGEHLHCAVEPVSSGATMVRFSHVAGAPASLKISEAAMRD